MTIQSLAQSNKGVLEPGFHHGFASAAYQIEGGFDQGGRGPSVWEAALKGQDNGDVACDSYNRSDDDIELLKAYGANSYRFSVSWSRIIPLGGRGDPVNREGLEWYSTFIDKLVEAGITPFITLFHWDLPQALQNRYAGFLASGEAEQELYADFAHFAKICFEAFGDRVKHWVTLNEPLIFSMLSATVLLKNSYDMETDRWIMARNLIMCHARAVHTYRTAFAHQQGVIGITLNMEWMEPFDKSPSAQHAATRALGLQAGVFADPIYLGRLNPMGKNLDKRGLLDFSPEEWSLIRGSSDFFGLNHYSTRLATGRLLDKPDPFQAFFGGVEYVTERDGQDIGHRGHDGHPYTVPWGFYKLLHYINEHWVKPSGRDIAIIVTENGYAEQDEAELPMSAIVDDKNRQAYFDGYISQMVAAKADGVPITGYFGWSLMDNLEWSAGYGPRFGVTHVDRDNHLKRTPKESAFLIKRIFQHLMNVE